MLIVVGNALLGAAVGSLLVAAVLDANFTLGGRAYYCTLAAMVFSGAVCQMLSR